MSVSQLPMLSDEQRRDGALRSLALRRQRAEFKAQLREHGWAYLDEHWLLEDIQGMRVFDLLRALPRIGAARAADLMSKAGIEHDRTVARCGHRQRWRLMELLDK